MSKYSVEFKLEVIKYYLEGHHSYPECSAKFNISSQAQIRQWVKKYKMYGHEGIVKNLKSSYDGIFKQSVVEYMYTNHLSASETAIKFRLGHHSVVLEWERIYLEEGPEGLLLRRRGGKNMKSKTSKKKSDENIEDLIEENERLRMENEYLKKLNALVQERIKRENKKK